MIEAKLYEKIENNSVRCNLCAHRCHILPDKFGICSVRQNISGVLYTHSYGKVVAAHDDPIEKKPLYHFLPGSKSFSIATGGCNFRCGFCQNWEISQRNYKEQFASNELSAEEIVGAALRHGCQSISYTYTEPTIFFEYAFDIARVARGKGLKNVFVTNGYMTKECINLIQPYLDAANVDLKFFNESAYKRICGGSLQPVLDSIALMHELGIWVEVTTLVVPGENDSPEELSGIAGFLAGIDRNIPWHISRFHPDYKFTQYRATPEATLKEAYTIAKGAGLAFVYVGNVYGLEYDTRCPSCNKLLIKREVFDVLEYNMVNGGCASCQAVIPGYFKR